MPEEPLTTERQLSGDEIIAEILRNAELNQFPIRRTILIPCIFHVYLHPTDYDAIRSVIPALTAESRSALKERVDELNKRARPSRVVKLLGFDDEPRQYRILDPNWTVEFHPDMEDKLQRADIEVHSDLASTPRPEFEGAMTRHVTRRQTPAAGLDRSDATVPVPRGPAGEEKVYGWLRYSDAGKEQTFAVVKDEIAIGRGGKTVWVDVRLNAPPDVSREHCRIRRDSATGRFYLKDLSQFGTTLDGRKVPSSIDRREGTDRDVHIEVELPAKASIELAGAVQLSFEAAHEY